MFTDRNTNAHWLGYVVSFVLLFGALAIFPKEWVAGGGLVLVLGWQVYFRIKNGRWETVHDQERYWPPKR